MNALVERLYSHIPVLCQDIAVSLYGFREECIRHWGNYNTYFEEVSGHLSFNTGTMAEYVRDRLKDVIASAANNVPYYRETFRNMGIRWDKIEHPDELSSLPLLEKETLRQHYSSLIDERYNVRKLLRIKTTGTTGTPLNIFCDRKTRQLNYAYYDRFLNLAGINYEGKRATFGGRLVVPSHQNKPPFWRFSYPQKNLMFSSYHLTEKNIPAYIAKLEQFKPDVIDAYPSSIYELAKYAHDHKIDLSNITGGITTSAETLFPEQRQTITSVFKKPIYDQYGAAEMCIFVGQCKEGSYHIHSDYGIVEGIKDDGTPADPGEEAEIVCTGFINLVMPLIRYRIGDRAVFCEERCACGSVFPVVKQIIGRMDDVIITPEGRKIGRLSPVLKGFPVKEVQYIQNDRESLHVIVVKGEGFSPRTERQIELELRKRIGTEMVIDFSYLERIPRGKGGKSKAVISTLKV